ncbi:MAG: S-adenosylmethionine:tRNA ribosyltransferase-isomerase [Planctomycetota bacterium]
MLRSELEFELPEDRIAQQPAVPRDHARLWVERLGEGRVASCQVRELAQFLRAGDLLVFNDTKVLPARVWAQRPTGGRLELLFLEPLPGGHTWLAMVRPAKKPRPGEVLRVAGSIQVRMVERKLDEWS